MLTMTLAMTRSVLPVEALRSTFLAGPEEELYLRSLAFRNVVLEFWLKATRVRSTRTTLVLGIVSNYLALLELRFLSTSGRSQRRVARSTIASSHPEIIDILTRPPRALHADRFITIFNFISLQVQAFAGHHDSRDHYVYTVFAGSRATAPGGRQKIVLHCRCLRGKLVAFSCRVLRCIFAACSSFEAAAPGGRQKLALHRR